MYYHLQLEGEIRLCPSTFGLARSTIHEIIEGSCDGVSGIVVHVTSVVSIGHGSLKLGSGFVTYPVKYKAIVFRPFRGEVVDVIVEKVLDKGLLCGAGPVDIFISRSSLLDDYEFDHRECAYKNKEESKMIRQDDVIRAKIVGVRVGVNDVFAIGSMCDDYLGG